MDSAPAPEKKVSVNAGGGRDNWPRLPNSLAASNSSQRMTNLPLARFGTENLQAARYTGGVPHAAIMEVVDHAAEQSVSPEQAVHLDEEFDAYHGYKLETREDGGELARVEIMGGEGYHDGPRSLANKRMRVSEAVHPSGHPHILSPPTMARPRSHPATQWPADIKPEHSGGHVIVSTNPQSRPAPAILPKVEPSGIATTGVERPAASSQGSNQLPPSWAFPPPKLCMAAAVKRESLLNCLNSHQRPPKAIPPLLFFMGIVLGPQEYALLQKEEAKYKVPGTKPPPQKHVPVTLEQRRAQQLQDVLRDHQYGQILKENGIEIKPGRKRQGSTAHALANSAALALANASANGTCPAATPHGPASGTGQAPGMSRPQPGSNPASGYLGHSSNSDHDSGKPYQPPNSVNTQWQPQQAPNPQQPQASQQVGSWAAQQQSHASYARANQGEPSASHFAIQATQGEPSSSHYALQARQREPSPSHYAIEANQGEPSSSHYAIQARQGEPSPSHYAIQARQREPSPSHYSTEANQGEPLSSHYAMQARQGEPSPSHYALEANQGEPSSSHHAIQHKVSQSPAGQLTSGGSPKPQSRGLNLKRPHSPGVSRGGEGAGSLDPRLRGDTPAYRYIVKANGRWRVQISLNNRAGGAGGRHKFYSVPVWDPEVAAINADRLLYKLRGPGAETNFPLSVAERRRLDDLALADVVDSLKSSESMAAAAVMVKSGLEGGVSEMWRFAAPQMM